MVVILLACMLLAGRNLHGPHLTNRLTTCVGQPDCFKVERRGREYCFRKCAEDKLSRGCEDEAVREVGANRIRRATAELPQL